MYNIFIFNFVDNFNYFQIDKINRLLRNHKMDLYKISLIFIKAKKLIFNHFL